MQIYRKFTDFTFKLIYVVKHKKNYNKRYNKKKIALHLYRKKQEHFLVQNSLFFCSISINLNN